MKNYKNVRLVAENNGMKPGFLIYLDFSGQREFLTFHRHNGILYNFLKDGVKVDDLYRWYVGDISRLNGRRRKGRSDYSQKLARMVAYLFKVIENHLDESEAA